MDSGEESDDDDASVNGLDDEEEDPLNQVDEIKLSRIPLSLQCVVVVVVAVAIEQLANSAVDVSFQNLKSIDQQIIHVQCEENYYFLHYLLPTFSLLRLKFCTMVNKAILLFTRLLSYL